MKRLAAIALVCLMAAGLFVSGCKDDSKPVLTRVTVSPQCGVVPLEVECYAMTSGGVESGDATGGNAALDINWNFGDGASSQTSISYHTYATPGEYTITVTATDPDGNQVPPVQRTITALADSLILTVDSNFPGGQFTTEDTLKVSFTAENCGVDPNNLGDYVNLSYEWQLTGPIEHTFYGLAPNIVLVTPGDYTLRLVVNYPTWAVFRDQVLQFTVTAP